MVLGSVRTVVYHDDQNVHAMALDGFQLLHMHHQTAIAVEQHDVLVQARRHGFAAPCRGANRQSRSERLDPQARVGAKVMTRHFLSLVDRDRVDVDLQGLRLRIELPPAARGVGERTADCDDEVSLCYLLEPHLSGKAAGDADAVAIVLEQSAHRDRHALRHVKARIGSARHGDEWRLIDALVISTAFERRFAGKHDQRQMGAHGRGECSDQLRHTVSAPDRRDAHVRALARARHGSGDRAALVPHIDQTAPLLGQSSAHPACSSIIRGHMFWSVTTDARSIRVRAIRRSSSGTPRVDDQVRPHRPLSTGRPKATRCPLREPL